MKLGWSVAACLILGVGIGWFVGSSQADLGKQRKLLQEYQSGRALGTQSELAEVGRNFRENVLSLQRTNELAAVLALAALAKLEGGDDQAATDRLVLPIQKYYRSDGADTNLIGRIEKAAQQSRLLAAAIKPKP